MKLKPSLKNSARSGLYRTIFILLILFACGCSSSTKPTYIRENIAGAVQDICKNEYKIDVTARLVGDTLWVYLPVEDMFVKNEKPEKYTEKFVIEQLQARFNSNILQVGYSIKAVPEQEKAQEVKLNKDISEKINRTLRVLYRVMFSMDHLKTAEPKFFGLITADIKNGILIHDIFYYLDLKKVLYQFISQGEFEHRMLQDINISPVSIGDKFGDNLFYKDIKMDEFIADQIKHRIKMKFQRPEVDKNANINKEIIKIVSCTVTAYNFKNFNFLELNNLVTSNKIFLNRQAIWTKTKEW